MANAADLEYLRRQRASAETNKRQGVQAINPNSGGLDALDNKQQGTGNVLLDAGSKVLGTIDELAANFGAGFVGAWEGILDFGATALGALGDATGWYDSKPFTDWAAQDIGTALSEWTKTYANFTPWGIGNMIGQSVERGPEYWEGMWDGFKDIAGSAFFMSTDLKDYREDSDKFYAFNDEMNSGVGQFAKGGARSIGGIVASMIGGNAVAGAISKSAAGAAAASGASKAGIEAAKQAALATKGAQAAVKAGQLGVLGLGAAGKQAEEELNQGTEAGKALATGALSGAVEAGTEMIPWSWGNSVGGVLTRGSIAKMGKKEFMLHAVEEGLEEFISGVMEPVVQAVGKQDLGQLKDSKGNLVYATKDFWLGGDDKGFNESVAGQTLSGAAIGGLMGGVQSVAESYKYGGTKQRNAVADMRGVLSVRQQIMEDYTKGKLSYEECESKLAQNEAVAKEIASELEGYFKAEGKSGEKFRSAFTQKGEDFLNEKEFLQYAKDGADPRTYKEYLRKYQDDFFADMKESITADGMAQIMDFMRANYMSANETRAEVIFADDEYLQGNKGFYDQNTNRLLINKKYAKLFANILAHEGIAHALLDRYEKTAKFEKWLEEIDPKGLAKNDDAIRRKYAKEIAKGGEEVFHSERVAFYLEDMMNNLDGVLKVASGKYGIKSFLKDAFRFGKKLQDARVMLKLSNMVKAIDSAKAYSEAKAKVDEKPAMASKDLKSSSEYNESKEGKNNDKGRDDEDVRQGRHGLHNEGSERDNSGSVRSAIRAYIDKKAEYYKGSIFKKDNQIGYVSELQKYGVSVAKDFKEAGFYSIDAVPREYFSPEMEEIYQRGQKIRVEVVFALNVNDNLKTGGEYQNGVAIIYIAKTETNINESSWHELEHGLFDKHGLEREQEFKKDFLNYVDQYSEAEKLYNKYAKIYKSIYTNVSKEEFRNLVAEEVVCQLYAGAESFKNGPKDLVDLQNDIQFWSKQVANKQNPDEGIRWSKNLDSDGEQLSENQVKFFENSKVRNDDGNLKPMYHGTERGDRVGYYFDPNRATAGPMAYFTDDRSIAEQYSKDKADTSIEQPDSYEGWFIDKKTKKPFTSIWNSLSYTQKMEIRRKAVQIRFDDEADGIIVDKNNKNGIGDLGYKLSQTDNVLSALVDEWLTDGNLFGEEERFLEVLDILGLKDRVEYIYGQGDQSKVYKVYLNVTKPFDTTKISEEDIEGIRNAVKAQPDVADTLFEAGVYSWNKKRISPKTWLEKFDTDMSDGTSHSWTIIPDYITDYLKEQGYDGIFDEGGKRGGKGHQVVIPFYPNQIKLTENKNPSDSLDIRYSKDLSAVELDRIVPEPETNDSGKITEIYVPVIDNMSGKFKRWNTEKVAKDLGDGFVVVENVPKPAKGEAPVEKKDTSNYKIMDSHTGRIVEHMDPTYNRMVGFAKRDITLKDFAALFTKEERQQALKAREKLLSNPDADNFASRYWKEYAETVKQTKKKARAKPKEVAPSKPGLVVGKPSDGEQAKAYEQPKQEAKVEEKPAPKEEPKPAEEKKAKPKKVEAEPVEQEKPDSNLVNLQSVLKEQGLEFDPANQNMMQFAMPFVDEKNTTYKRVIFKQPLFDSVGPVYGIVREGNEVIRDEKVWEKASKKKALKQESTTEEKPVEKPKLNPKPSAEPVEIANRQERTPKPKTDAKYTLKTGEFHNYNAPRELKEGNTDESKSKYGIVLFINPITDTIGTVYGYDGITANNIRPCEEWVNFIENGLNKNDVNFIQDEERIKRQNKELYETIKDDTRALAEAIVDLSPTKFLTIETAQALMQERKKEAAEKLAKANDSSKKVKDKEAEKKPAEEPKKTEKKATTPKVEKPAEPAKEPVKEAKPVKETKATKEAKPAKEIKKEAEKPKELPKKDGVTDLSSVAGLTVGRPVESKPQEEKKPTKKKAEKKVAEKPKEEAPKEAPKEEAKKEVKEKPKKEPKIKPETKVIVKEVEKPGSMPKEEVDRMVDGFLSTIELEREERVEVESKLRENIVELRALPPLAQKLTVAHLNANVISGTILEVPSSSEALVGNEYRAAMVPFAKAGIMADGKLQLKVFVPAIRSLADMYTEENFGAMFDPAIGMVLDNIYLWDDSGSATYLQEKQAFALFKAIKSLGSKRFRQVELNRIRQAAEADYGMESLGKYKEQAPMLRTAEKIVSIVSDPRATTEMMFSSLTNVGDKLINDASKQAGFSRVYEFDAEARIQKIQQDFGLGKERAGVKIGDNEMPYLAALEWRLMLSMPDGSKEYKNANIGYTYHDAKTDHDVTVSYSEEAELSLREAIPDEEFQNIRKAIVDDYYGEFIYDKIAEIYKRNTNLDLGELMPRGEYIRLTTARLRTSLLAGKVVGAPSTSNLKKRNSASAPIRMGQGLFAKMRDVAKMTAYEYYMQPLLSEVDHIFNTLQINGKATILSKLGITKQQFLKWYVDALSGAAKPEATGAFGQAMVQMTLANFKIAPIQMLSAFTSGLSVTEQFNPVLLKNAFKPDAKHQKALDNLFEVLPEARNRGARNEVYAGNVGETKATIFSRYMRKIGEFVSKYTGTNMTDKATIRYILLAALNTTAKEMSKSIDDVEAAKATEQRARTLYMTQISSDTKFMSPAQHVSNPYGNTTGTQKVAMRMVKAFGGAAKAFTNYFNRSILKLHQMNQAEKWVQSHSEAEYDEAINSLNEELGTANSELAELEESLERNIKKRDEARDEREKDATASKKWKKAIKYLHKLEDQLAEAKRHRNKEEIASLTEQVKEQKEKVASFKSGFTEESQARYENAKFAVESTKHAISEKKSQIHLLENKVATQQGYKEFFNKTSKAVIAWKRDKEASKLVMNLIFGMLLAGLGKTFIDEIYNLVFKRKEIDEVLTPSLAGEVMLNSTVNLYPGLRTIAGIFQGNEASDPTIKTFNLISDSIQSVTAFGKNQSDANRKALLRNSVQIISLISGIPFKTVYDQVNGLIGWFNPEAALEMKNVFYQVSNTASGKFNKAIEDKKTSEAISYLGYLSNERVGNMTDSLKQEVVRLNEAGESFVPSELPSSYKDEDGKEVTLSWSQKQQAKQYYSKANYFASKVISRADYRKLSNASKAYVLKTIYNSYRNASLWKSNLIASKSLTKYGLIASTNHSALPQIFVALASIKELTGDKNSTRKEQAIRLVNSMSLDKNQKALVLYLAGFKVDDSYVKAALRNMGANMSEITQLLS